jgi:hypothetical protein
MSNALVVTGMVARTSLGDAVSAAAAARARLARPGPLERLAFDPEEGSIPVTGHPIPAVTGFQGEARLLALLGPALGELAALPPPLGGEPLAFLLAAPDLDRRGREAGSEPSRVSGFLELLVARTGTRVPPELRHTFPGRTGVARALQAARELLSQERAGACVVAAVDSLCDDLALDALAATRRLKTEDNPVGCQPGEGAVVLRVETAEHARRRHAPSLGRIGALGLSREPRTGDLPPLGEGLFGALQALGEPDPSAVGPALLVLDRNGESERASDWGYCLVRLKARSSSLADAPAWDPAISFGDTGTVSAALGVVLAMRGFTRGYAPSASAVVLSSAEDGGRAAIRLYGSA